VISALVPAKSLDRAKGRLASLLSEEERRQLALAMLEDVVRALQAVPSIDAVTVISPDAEVLAKARELGAEGLGEPASVRGINQALVHGMETAVAEGADTVLIVLADVPAVTPADIESVLTALPDGRGVAICPSSARGTSILALRPPNVIPFRFGQNSFAAHKREVMARGITASVARIDSVANDIDEPEDLRELLAHPAETATHALLAQLRIAGRLG
jgi:2-phospho-L-lactate guanylyltransferase